MPEPEHHEYGTHELGGIPEAVVINQFLKMIGSAIGSALPKNYGFMLMIFEFGGSEEKRKNLFYISSAQRDTMLKAMGEFIERSGEK